MKHKFFIAIMLMFGFVGPAMSDTVSSAQRMLNQLGYNAGAVDGAYGGKTRTALEKFYADNGSSYDGKLDTNEVADLTAAMEAAGINAGVTQNYETQANHFSADWKVRGKYVLPLKSMVSKFQGTRGPDPHEYRQRLGDFMTNFYGVGDFNGDGIQDIFVTGYQNAVLNNNSNLELSDDGSVWVAKDIVGKKRGFRVFAGDPRTGIANDYYRNGGEQITDMFIEDKTLSGIADNQLSNQQVLVADFNGDGRDDVWLSSAINSKFSSKPGGHAGAKFFGGYHSYYLSQPNGTHVESSREMLSGKFVDRKTGRYTEFSHRADVGDLDGDGDIDIVHTSVSWNGNNGVTVCLINDGNGKMKSKSCGNQWANNVIVGDYNGDGNQDLAIFAGPNNECKKYFNYQRDHGSARATSRVMFGNGSGKFSTSRSRSNVFADGHFGYHVSDNPNANGKMPVCGVPDGVAMDVDNDGDIDIVANTIGLLYVGGYFQVFENDGAGNFSLGQQIVIQTPNVNYDKNNYPTHENGHGSSGYCHSVSTIDLNEDGFMDFFCEAFFHSPADGLFYINNGDGTFKDAPKWLINRHVSSF